MNLSFGQGKKLTARGSGKNITQRENKKKVVAPLPSISPKKKEVSKPKGKSPNKKSVVVKTPVIKIQQTKPLSITEEAEKLLAEDENTDLNGTGFIKVRFNHYNKPFPIHNGVLRWSLVDDEYCISFVYKGNYSRDLRQELSGEGRNIVVSESNVRRDENGVYFLGLTAKNSEPVTYRLVLEEDPDAGVGAEGLRVKEGPLIINKDNAALQSGNKAVNDITNSLLNMKTSDLHSEEAKDLRERRDLEDILYS